MSHILDIARRYVAVGLSVIPITHGDKHPDHRRLEATTGITTHWTPESEGAAWRTYCSRIATDDELRTWFADGEAGIGIVGGQISGGLVRIDFEHAACLPAWRLAIEWVQPGGTKVVDLLPTVETGKGHHVYFRMPDPPGHVLLSSFGVGNEQLVLAETQGEGCYCVAPPSAVPGSYEWPGGADHGRYTRAYQWVAGDVAAIPTFSQELGNLLLDQARFSQFLEAKINDLSSSQIKVSRSGLLLHRTIGGRYEDWYLPWESVHTLRSYFERYAALLRAVETAPPPPPSYLPYDDDEGPDRGVRLMHECPQCGQACDCDGEDVWNDAAAAECTHDCEDEEETDDQEGFGLEACVDCGSPEISTMCQCCGGWLCYRHSETGAGFCKACPTKEWIDEQQERLKD